MYLLVLVDHDASSDDFEAALDNALCYLMINNWICYVMTDNYAQLCCD